MILGYTDQHSQSITQKFINVKISLENILDDLDITNIGRLSRLDDAVIGISIGEEHDGEPHKFIYEYSLMLKEIKAESPPDLDPKIYESFVINLIKRTKNEQECSPIFVKTL